MTVNIVPSILSADFARLGEQVREAVAAGADWIRVDVMDGHFVPNMTVGPLIGRALRPVTDLPLSSEIDRSFIIQATQVLFAQARNARGFRVTLMYDYGTLRDVPNSQRTERMIDDLRYAIDTYLTHPVYLTYNNRPLLFLFPYEDVTPDVRLDQVTSAISQANLSLIYQNPTTASTIFPYVDGVRRR